MRYTRSESMEIPWCEPLDEPDLMVGTILVTGHRTVLSTYVHTCGLGENDRYQYALKLFPIFWVKPGPIKR